MRLSPGISTPRSRGMGWVGLCVGGAYPCFCLWRGFLQTTRTTFLRRTILQLSQMRLTDARTFMGRDRNLGFGCGSGGGATGDRPMRARDSRQTLPDRRARMTGIHASPELPANGLPRRRRAFRQTPAGRGFTDFPTTSIAISAAMSTLQEHLLSQELCVRNGPMAGRRRRRPSTCRAAPAPPPCPC